MKERGLGRAILGSSKNSPITRHFLIDQFGWWLKEISSIDSTLLARLGIFLCLIQPNSHGAQHTKIIRSSPQFCTKMYLIHTCYICYPLTHGYSGGQISNNTIHALLTHFFFLRRDLAKFRTNKKTNGRKRSSG